MGNKSKFKSGTPQIQSPKFERTINKPYSYNHLNQYPRENIILNRRGFG